MCPSASLGVPAGLRAHPSTVMSCVSKHKSGEDGVCASERLKVLGMVQSVTPSAWIFWRKKTKTTVVCENWCKKQLVDVSGPLDFDLKVFCTIIWTGARALEQMKVIKKILLM